ncbi:MAG: methyltransferase family protein [Promethearchaeota archaeon]
MIENKHNDLKIEKQMSLWGVGPKIVLVLLPFIILFCFLHFTFYPLFLLPFESLLMIIIGIIFIIIGIPIYFKSRKTIIKAYHSSELVTSGIYGHMRHPLYGAFILFITPGIVFIFNSWILFFIPLSYYIIFRIFIRKEERYCIEKFGEQYIKYKKQVYAIFPKLKAYKTT